MRIHISLSLLFSIAKLWDHRLRFALVLSPGCIGNTFSILTKWSVSMWFSLSLAQLGHLGGTSVLSYQMLSSISLECSSRLSKIREHTFNMYDLTKWNNFSTSNPCVLEQWSTILLTTESGLSEEHWKPGCMPIILQANNFLTQSGFKCMKYLFGHSCALAIFNWSAYHIRPTNHQLLSKSLFRWTLTPFGGFRPQRYVYWNVLKYQDSVIDEQEVLEIILMLCGVAAAEITDLVWGKAEVLWHEQTERKVRCASTVLQNLKFRSFPNLTSRSGHFTCESDTKYFWLDNYESSKTVCLSWDYRVKQRGKLKRAHQSCAKSPSCSSTKKKHWETNEEPETVKWKCVEALYNYRDQVKVDYDVYMLWKSQIMPSADMTAPEWL